MSDYIPDELLIEILARLPVASLLRFQSVCKSWYSLITNPGFVTKHLIQSITNGKRNGDKLLVRLYDIINKERYLLLNDDDKFGGAYLEFEFPFKIPFGYFRVVGSCNGLLCVAGDYFTDKAKIMIWNPSTRKSVTLPMAPKPQGPHMCVYGFGSHPTTHEYEVIRIRYEIIEMVEYELKLPPKVEIYTQGTRSWRGISSAVPSYRIVNYMWCQAFVDGAVHWVAYETCVGSGVRNLIMLFNMASEAFCEFKLPPTLADQPPPSLSIKTFGQSLAVLCNGPRDAGGCCIWVMKEYGVAESWSKLFSSNLLGMPNKTLGFRRNGEVLLASNNSLASYAPGTNTLATTGIKGSLRAFYVDPFMQTLVSV